MYTGEVEQLTLFKGKLYTPSLSLLYTGLPGSLEVVVCLLCVLANC